MPRLAVIVLVCVAGCAPPPPTTPSPVPATNLPLPATPPMPAGVSPLAGSMLSGLASYMVSAYAEVRDLIPRNPQLVTYIHEKMTMLESPALIGEIFSQRRWIDGTASTVAGGPTPIAAVFALESMRAESTDAVRIVERHLPVLTEFFDEAFPTGAMRIWYGFTTGATGGGGAMYVVDRTTQDRFRSPVGLRYDAMLAHEAAHSYISNEALTQFLELYVDNTVRGASVDPLTWTETRGWTPTVASSFGVTHVMDIYHRVGFDATRRAYRAIRPLRPAYGQPLSAAVIAAFLAEVPSEHRAFVQGKLAAIIA